MTARKLGRAAAGALSPRPLPAGPLDRAATLAAFGLGATLATIFLVSIGSVILPIATGALTAALLAFAGWGGARRPAVRVATGVAWGVLALIHLFWWYEALAFGALLAWTTSWWLDALVFLLGVAAIAGKLPRWTRARVPLALPLGVWIAACLGGWRHEEAYVRCDDYRRLIAQPDVALVLATTGALATCRPGQSIYVARYPRKIWESPDGARYVFTTQSGDRALDPNRRAPGRLSGSVCEIGSDGHGEPACVGYGKAHGLVEADALGKLFVGAWGTAPPGRSVIYELPLAGPIHILRETHLPELCGDFFYEHDTDTLHAFCDEGDRVYPVRASTLEPAPEPIAAPILPGEVRYDAARHEGVLCQAAGPLLPIGGASYLAIAVSGVPAFAIRPLGSSHDAVWTWLALSWGCDWDPARREVYAAVPDLGLLATIDYDTGRILRTAFVGVGLRSVAYDARRRRAYLTNFLRGDVIAVDVATGAIAARWFGGRFVREVKLARDGDHLLVTSNLGLVRITLPPAGATP